MARDDEQSTPAPQQEPNLPLVPVRGVTGAQAMRLFERYHLDFAPPTYTELKLCEVILALEETVLDFTRAEQRRRGQP